MASAEEAQQFVQMLNGQIDQSLNGPPGPDRVAKVGFVLVLFSMEAPEAGCTVTSNCQSGEAVAKIMKTQGEKIEAQLAV